MCWNKGLKYYTKHSYKKACEEKGLNYKTFQKRYYTLGWTLNEALNTPTLSKEEVIKRKLQGRSKDCYFGNLHKTLPNYYYQRVRLLVRKYGVRIKDALIICQTSRQGYREWLN